MRQTTPCTPAGPAGRGCGATRRLGLWGLVLSALALMVVQQAVGQTYTPSRDSHGFPGVRRFTNLVDLTYWGAFLLTLAASFVCLGWLGWSYIAGRSSDWAKGGLVASGLAALGLGIAPAVIGWLFG